jgi:hypothetical protein
LWVKNGATGRRRSRTNVCASKRRPVAYTRESEAADDKERGNGSGLAPLDRAQDSALKAHRRRRRQRHPRVAERLPPHSTTARACIVREFGHAVTAVGLLVKAVDGLSGSRIEGAEVVGPVSTTTDAVRLISERTPDVALVDINLQGGERSYELIDRLYDRGIRIVVICGYGWQGQAPWRS